MAISDRVTPAAEGTAIGLAPWTVLQRIFRNLVDWIVLLVRAPRVRPPSWSAGALAAIGITLAIIIALMFVADARVIAWALTLPPNVHDIADWITDFGRSSWFLYPLLVILLGLAAVLSPSLPRQTRGVLGFLAARFGFLFVAVGLPSLFDTIIKRLIGRARPYVGGHDDPFSYMPFIWRPEYASMPSGHATTATAAALAIGAIWPRMRPVMWVYASTIIATRVVIGVHHPSDVLGGALVGVVGALLVRRWFAARRLVFRADDLRPFPGPSRPRLRAAARTIVGAPASH
jgi:undecaprenyl-diphosphatase